MSKRGLSVLVNNYATIFKSKSEDTLHMKENQLFELYRAYIRVGDYAHAGDLLNDWLISNRSEKVSQTLDKLKSNIRLVKAKGKLYEIKRNEYLGPFAEPKYKIVATEVTKYDEHGRVIKHIEREGLKIEDYARYEYEYKNGDHPTHYVKYDKDGSVIETYDAVIGSNGRVESSESTYEGDYKHKHEYVYDLDGLLIRKIFYRGDTKEKEERYAYDDLDRLIHISSSNIPNSSYYESWNYKYTRHSRFVTRIHNNGHRDDYAEVKENDFMGNIVSVEKQIYRSDSGWTNTGYIRRYTNVYVRK